jgi:hypothetical protein
MGLVNNLCTEGCPHSIFSFWSRSFFLQTWNLNIVLTGYAMCAAKSILYRTTDSFRSMVGAWFRNEESTGTASYCPAGIYFFLIPQLIHFRIVLWLASMNWLEGSLTSLEICHLCHPNFLSCMEESWWNLPRLLCGWAGSSEPVAQVPGTRTFGPVSGYGGLGCGSGNFWLFFWDCTSSNTVHESLHLVNKLHCLSRCAVYDNGCVIH